jgi:hypothetical protein
MARSLYSISPSPGPGPLSPSFSDDSSDIDGAPSALTDFHHQAAVKHSSSCPASPTRGGPPPPPLDLVTCQWEDCGSAFDDLAIFIRHLHEGTSPFPSLGLFPTFRQAPSPFFSLLPADHIGVHKSNYTCEWATCARRGLPQTSRFALISHLRSHTGEKPFTCELPGTSKPSSPTPP